LGRIVFSKLRLRLQPIERELLAGISGAAILSVLAFALCALQLVYVGSFVVLGAGQPLQASPHEGIGRIAAWASLCVFASAVTSIS